MKERNLWIRLSRLFLQAQKVNQLRLFTISKTISIQFEALRKTRDGNRGVVSGKGYSGKEQLKNNSGRKNSSPSNLSKIQRLGRLFPTIHKEHFLSLNETVLNIPLKTRSLIASFFKIGSHRRQTKKKPIQCRLCIHTNQLNWNLISI